MTGNGSTGRRTFRLLAIAAAAGLAAQGAAPALGAGVGQPGRAVLRLPAPGSAAEAALLARHHLRPPKPAPMVPGHHAAPRPAPPAPRPVPAGPRPSWPAAGKATATGSGSWRQAGRLPIWLASPAGASSPDTPGLVRKASVTMAPHQAAVAAGADGVIFSVTRADGAQTTGQVKIRLNYKRFTDAYGGGYGPRLQLFAMPACALSTPRVKACRAMMPVPTVNDALARTLSATVAAEPAVINRTGSAVRSPVVYAATSTSSGGTGDFKATSLSPSSQWDVGLQTGDFHWSYPLRVPPGIGGNAPSLSLSYDSGVTDGETAQDNSQPGQLGEGFSLNGSVGFIERRYVSCGDLITGTTKGSSNDTDQTFSTGDQCWDGANAFLSIGGHSTELIQSGSTWHLADDDGSTVQFRTDTTNGAYQNQYWEITTHDGTQYYYGLNELPGFQSGNTPTNSVWTMPVFGLGSGDPCHASPPAGSTKAPYASSYCANMPWRWNLDLVVDPNGNATSYFYNKQTNYYASDSYVDGSGTLQSGTVLPYTSGGTLTDIWYGMQDTSATSPNSGGNVYAHKAFSVHFAYADRCSLYGTATTYNTDYGNATTKSTCENNETEASGDWPDTPWDLACSSTANCTGPNHDSPVFFDTQMLATVTTSIEQGFNTPEAVDTWTLGYNWQPADVNDDLVLAAIIHAGDVGSSPVSLKPVKLGYIELNNRVPYGENFPAMQRYWLTSVISEAGAVTDIGYNTAHCSPTKQTDPSTNDLPCFPQKWTAGDFGGSPTTLWFYKYTVSAVSVNDETGDEPTMLTAYKYCNNPACGSPNTGAAWHFDTDVDLVPEKDKSYGQWRGYQYVEAVTGASGDTQSETDYTFMRGMYGDPLPHNTNDITTITPSDTTGTTQAPTAINDINALNGFALEKISYNGLNSAAQVSDVVNWPWTSTTGTSVTEPWGMPITSVLTDTAETDTYTPLSPRGNGGTAGTRQTQTVSKHNATTGLLTQTDDVGDLSDPSQERCTKYSYPSPASTANLLKFPAEIKVTAGACSATSPALISDTQYSYDGQANGVAPVSGNVTETDVFASGNTTTSGNHWVRQSRDGYDSYGRLTTSENSDGFTTTTTDTSSFGTGYATTSVLVHSPLTAATGENTATTLQPEWGSPATYTDADNERTDYAYDQLGRVTSIWLPGQTGTTPATDGTANYSYSYNITKTVAPSVTTTKLVGGNLLPITSVQIFDSLLRPRQTQTPAEGKAGGMEVTDTFYDSRGNTVITNGPYPAAANPSGSLWEITEPAVPNETLNTYDGANRVTSSDFYSKGTLKWGTTTTYTGSDEVTQIPPSGGTITSTFTDARGHTSEVDQYHSKTAASGNYDATAYAYTAAGQLSSVTDPGGNQWNYTYDLLGRQLTATDPDTGTTTNTYNDAGQLTSVTDGAGDTVSYTYDAASRKTGEFAAPVTSQAGSNQLAAWTYDSSAMTAGTKKAFGLLASTTSYVGGTAGEAYTKNIDTYDAGDNPVSTTWTIPSNSVTGALAGTYTFGTTYNLDDGTPSTLSYPANGPLPAETVNYIEDGLGNPSTEWSDLSDYVTHTIYDGNAQPEEIDLGLSTAADWTRMEYSYDDATLRLANTQVQRESTKYANDTNTGYSYNDAGNITAISDSVSGNNQCFNYDYLARLTAAWAQSPASCPASPPAATGLGGPHPYEQALSYDNTGTANGSHAGTTGNITGSTLITVSGTTTTTAATSYTYPAYTAAQPHTPTNESTTVNGGTPTATTLDWTGPGQPGYLATESGGTSATYNWDGTGAKPGQLFSAKTGAKNTSYRYDADGNLLVVKDASTSTLYLPSETLTANGTTVSGTRYYTHDGKVIAARTSSTAVSWLLPDPQGTATTAVDANSQTLTRRYYTPYGLELGTPPPSWPGNRGYIDGKTDDDTTNLVDLGAREYNPVLPVFISPDPVLTPDNPTDLNPYSYAFNNPVTREDPTGLRPTGPNGTCSTTWTCPSVSLDNNPIYYGGWSDAGAGLLNGIYSAVSSGLEAGALIAGGPKMAQAVASILPARLPIGDASSVWYRTGFAGSFLIPLGGEEAAADGLGVATRTAIQDTAKDLAPEAGGGGSRVIVDTNAVFNRPGVMGALNPGEMPVMTQTTSAELGNLVARGSVKMPRFAGDLPQISDVMDVNTRINIRGMIADMKPNSPGLFGDGSIGATALDTGFPVITADKNFAAVLAQLGVEVRVP